MYLLTLFHRDDPAHPIAAHMAADGRIRVGRDSGADWVVADPNSEVSRTHFELACSDGALSITPLGTNGVQDDAGATLAHGQPHALTPGDAIHFGQFRMTVEAPARLSEASLAGDRTNLAAPFGTDLAVPSAWPDATPRLSSDSGESLLDAFCRGADLDVSTFSGEDPALALERAGEIYRQMVLGLSDLMQARSVVKRDHHLERTTIGAEDNNPFKWAPSRRLASDLLLRQDAGFLNGPEAIRDSFGDVKKHMLGSLAGFRAAISAVLAALRPAEIETRVKSQRSLLQTQAAACWTELVRSQAALESEWAAGTSGTVNSAFVAAYEASVSEDGTDTASFATTEGDRRAA